MARSIAFSSPDLKIYKNLESEDSPLLILKISISLFACSLASEKSEPQDTRYFTLDCSMVVNKLTLHREEPDKSTIKDNVKGASEYCPEISL